MVCGAGLLDGMMPVQVIFETQYLTQQICPRRPRAARMSPAQPSPVVYIIRIVIYSTHTTHLFDFIFKTQEMKHKDLSDDDATNSFRPVKHVLFCAQL